MLVLSRGEKESVMIYPDGPGGPTIIVTVTEIDRGKVRLGFSAPRDMAIVRAELVAVGGHRCAAVNHLPRRPFPPCKVCGRGVACQPSDYVKNFYGVCSTCKREEPLRSQYHARIDAHQRRIQAELVRMGDAA
jgi:carbon storage regulator CsrA